MTLAAGMHLGPYEILSPLGSGGIGAVYRARDTRLQREVAIKVLPARHAGDPGRRQRLLKEAQAVSALNHPKIPWARAACEGQPPLAKAKPRAGRASMRIQPVEPGDPGP